MPGAHLPEDFDDAQQDHEVDDAQHDQERAGHADPDGSCHLVQRGVAVLDLADDRAHAQAQQHTHRENDRRVPEAEPEPDGQRPPALLHQLAGGVVDRRDVVDVERVPHTQRVGGNTEADAEGLASDLEVLRGNDHEQQAEADRVERDDQGSHPAEAAPLLCAEAVAPPGPELLLPRCDAGHRRPLRLIACCNPIAIGDSQPGALRMG
jgi:hypothetical protein